MKNKVLLVDDDIVTSKILEHYLADAGFEVKTASDGVDAFKKINDFVPDIILSDVVMPNMDGFEFLRRLKYKPGLGGVPFVFLSAKTENKDQLKGFRHGADDYICKPVERNEFIESINKILKRACLQTGNMSMQADFIAKISETELDDLVQLFEIGQKSGKLVFRTPGGRESGILYFEAGCVVYAKKGGLRGEDAFFELMNLRSGTMAFYSESVNLIGNIVVNTKALLLNSALMKDEYETLKQNLPDFKVQLRLHTSRVPQILLKKFGNGNLFKIMTLVLEGFTVEEILKSGHMSALRAGSIISNLLQEKIAGRDDASVKRKPSRAKKATASQ